MAWNAVEHCTTVAREFRRREFADMNIGGRVPRRSMSPVSSMLLEPDSEDIRAIVETDTDTIETRITCIDDLRERLNQGGAPGAVSRHAGIARLRFAAGQIQSDRRRQDEQHATCFIGQPNSFSFSLMQADMRATTWPGSNRAKSRMPRP